MENTSIGKKTAVLLWSQLTAWLVTALLLLFLALLLFKLELNEKKVSLGLSAIYVLACFFGGLAAGKGGKRKKFLWGLLTGAIYFSVLFLLSWKMSAERSSVSSCLLAAMLCLGGGMIGGMVS